MKNFRQILVALSLTATGAMSAQDVLVWENTFNTPEERAGWRFSDGNNNNNTWNIGKHIVRQAASPNMYEEVSPDYVLRYSAYRPNVVGGPANFKDDYINDFEDWVISPEIDLTGASGDIVLAAMIGKVSTYSTTSASNNTYRDIFVYVSTPAKPIPDFTDFQALRANITSAYVNDPNVVPKRLNVTNADYTAAGTALFVQATADLSQFSGKKIYIGFWHNVNFVNNSAAISTAPFKDTNSSNTFQIDEMQVFANSNTLATSDAKNKPVFTVYPNPASDVLYLKGVSKASVKVFSLTGQQLLSTVVNNGKIDISTLPKGVYNLSLEINGNSSTVKFIKK